eukprot:gene6448-10455_t
MSILNIHHLNFCVGNTISTTKSFCKEFNFIKYAFNTSGDRFTETLKQNQIIMSFTSSTSPNDEEFHEYYRKHGDLSIFDIAFSVENIEELYERTTKAGAKSIQKPTKIEDEFGFITIAVVQPPFAPWKHTLIELKNYKGTYLPNYTIHKIESKKLKQKLNRIDHLAIALEKDTLMDVTEWYITAFGFSQFISHDDATLTIKNKNSGMNVAVLQASEEFKCVFIQPIDGKKKSQIQEFLDYHSGPGVTHAALSTNDIINAIDEIRTSGIEFVSILDDYYEKWKLKKEFKNIKEDWKDIFKMRILVDGYFEEDTYKYLLQTFTTPLTNRPTFYFEIIQRNFCFI